MPDRGHRPRKRFGQHFLRDEYVVDRIVALVDPAPGQRIIEIGPGEGVLTAPLLASGAEVLAVEIDRDLAAALRRRFAERENFSLVENDVLRFDFAALQPAGCRWRVVGNLPYNISTPLLERLLAAGERIADMTLMLQREVAERLMADPGSRTYGRLSIMAARRATVEAGFNVGPESFAPPPKVDSSVIRVIPRATDTLAPELDGRVDDLVRAAFSARRKTIANALRGHLGASDISACDIDPRARAEVLSPADFERLAAYSLAPR